MSDPTVAVPAVFVTFDDTIAALGATSAQQALEILAAKLASLQTFLGVADGELDFSNPGDSALDTAT